MDGQAPTPDPGPEEEAKEGELVQCLVDAMRQDGQAAFATEMIDAISHLGILHHNFSRKRTAMLLLKTAEGIVKDLDASLVPDLTPDGSGGGEPTGARGLDAATDTTATVSAATGEESSQRHEVASLYTHVCFYLAQAYSTQQQPHMAASYCLRTLQLQLRMDHAKFDPAEWYRNCSGLVDYFTMQHRYHDAEHCLRACDRVIDDRLAVPAPPAAPNDIADARERRAEAEADMHRRWAVHHLTVLQEAAEVRLQGVEAAPVPSVPQSIHFGLGLPLSSTKMPAQVTDFDAARTVFKAANGRVQKALDFFVLDGWVTDHVGLLRNQSHLYRWLAVFEDDEKRVAAMLRRRADALAPLLQVLSKTAFQDLHKQLSFEVGEVCMELTELKLARLTAKQSGGKSAVKRSDMSKVNGLVDEAVDAFTHFTELYRQPKPEPLLPPPPKLDPETGEPLPPEPPEEVPVVVDDDELQVYLRAHFYTARLLGKKLPLPSTDPKTPNERVQGLERSLAKYQFLLEHARDKVAQVKDAAARAVLFKDELAMCEQMVELLPAQIDRVHHLGMGL